MADDTAVVTEKTKETVTEPQYTEAEQLALNNGWVPKDQWQGDPEDFVSARQFNKNGELFGRINSYKGKIQNLERTVSELVKHNEKVYDVGYKDALASLKAERKVALREGDTERVLALDERVDELQEDYQRQKQEFVSTVKQPAAQPASNPVWDAWAANNTWYETDAALHGYADGEARTLVEAAQAAGRPVEFDKLLREVSRKVKEKFPEKFGFQKPASPTNRGDDTPSGRRSTSNSGKYTLTDMEEEIFKTLEKSGLTREKYVEDLKKVKSRKGE